MLVLGLDPGIATTGYGLVRLTGNRLTGEAFGTVRTPAGQALPGRLLSLHRELASICGRYKPDAAAMEELFFAKNARTAMVVGQARGVAMLALAEAGLSVAEYTPLQVKQAVVGYGRAEKRQVQEMVRILLRLDRPPQPDDAADALAVAICHAHTGAARGREARGS